MQVYYLHVGLDYVVGKELFNENQPHIILHLFYIQHCVRKTWRGWAPASWLVMPFIADLVPIACTSYSMTSSAIRAPTCRNPTLRQM
jgi:hypothetical protein